MQASRRKVAAMPKGRPGWMVALRDYEHQYDDRDPGNSPEWDAYMRATK